MQIAKRFPFLFFIILLLSTVKAEAKPNWVKTFGHSTKYPTDKYFVGFGSAIGISQDAAQIAQDNAHADIFRAIIARLNNLLSRVKAENNQQLSQHLSSMTQRSTAIQLKGIQTELYVDKDSIHPTTYALIYVSREALRSIYTKEQSELRNQIRQIIVEAQSYERDSRNTEAGTKYLNLYPLYEALKETEAILIVATSSRFPTTASDGWHIRGYNSALESMKSSLMSRLEVADKIDRLSPQPIASVDDVVRAIAFQFSKQVEKPNGAVLVLPLTYQHTKMSSSFARYLRSALEIQLSQMAEWRFVSQADAFQPKTSQITRDLAKASGAAWLISGTYWEQGRKIKLMATMRNVDTGVVVAGAEALFYADILKAVSLSPTPKNFKRAQTEQKAFAVEDIGSSSLHVEVWTNRGVDNLLFTEGDDMKVYVRVNRAAYIRLIYILADGQHTVLYDDLYIDPSQVNRVIEVPEEFECSAPFGAEMLVAVARTKPFDTLDTVERKGYKIVKAKTPKDAVAKIRGFKRKQKVSDIQQSEARIIITTMER